MFYNLMAILYPYVSNYFIYSMACRYLENTTRLSLYRQYSTWL